MQVHVRASTQSDVDHLATNLRPEDTEEVLASHGDVKEALQQGLDESEECWTIVVKETGEIAGIYGVVGLEDNLTGIPWLLTAPPITKVWLPFLRGSLKWVQETNKKYPILTNACDADYDVAINWLKFLGFSFLRELEYGVGKAPFYEFVRIK